MALRKGFPAFGENIAIIAGLTLKSHTAAPCSLVNCVRPTFLSRTLATGADPSSTSFENLDPSSTPFEKLSDLCKDMSVLTELHSLANWDERVMMSPKPEAVESRGRHKAAIAVALHEKATSEELSTAIQAAKLDVEEYSDYQKATLRDADRNYNLIKGVPIEDMYEISEHQPKARSDWLVAKDENDYSKFMPSLDKTVTLLKKKALNMSPARDPYDTMLDMFEREMTADRLDGIFGSIKKPLQDLIRKILDKKSTQRKVHPALLGTWDKEKQMELGKHVAGELGYDESRGRIDEGGSAFAAPMGFDDVRVVTALESDDLYHGLRITMHESGHAIYEQGKNRNFNGVPVGQALSIGAHESQSLFYERMIGRQLAFFEAFLPKIHEIFPQTQSATADDMYFAANQVARGPLWRDADELTYPLHIMLRYELEKKMVDGSLDLKDLPDEWNRGMKDLLGVDVKDDREGCLQDVHWSLNYVGYFPGYFIGALTAAQLYRHLETKVMPDIQEQIRAGNFGEINKWLNQEIHAVGSLHPSLDELLVEVTEEELNPQHFLDYVTEKYEKLYA